MTKKIIYLNLIIILKNSFCMNPTLHYDQEFRNALLEKNSEKVRQLLEKGINPNLKIITGVETTDNYGKTASKLPLEISLESDDIDSIKHLLKKGADPEKNGAAPMLKAIHYQNTKAFDLFLKDLEAERYKNHPEDWEERLIKYLGEAKSPTNQNSLKSKKIVSLIIKQFKKLIISEKKKFEKMLQKKLDYLNLEIKIN